MTNRERIEAMTDEQLAKFICIGIDGTNCCKGQCCDGRECVDCMVEWLRSEDKPKRGDVRKIGNKFYLVVRVHENDSKLMYSDGSYGWVSNDVFLTDKPSDMSIDDFFKMAFKNM